MSMINSLILEGNVTKTGTLEGQYSGVSQIEFTIGVERRYMNREGNDVNEISEFDIVGYGHLAEYFAQNRNEVGQGVRVVGRLKQIKWDVNGEMKSRVVVVAEHIEYRAFKKEAKDEK